MELDAMASHIIRHQYIDFVGRHIHVALLVDDPGNVRSMDSWFGSVNAIFTGDIDHLGPVSKGTFQSKRNTRATNDQNFQNLLVGGIMEFDVVANRIVKHHYIDFVGQYVHVATDILLTGVTTQSWSS